jgi:hypothetical protein
VEQVQTSWVARARAFFRKVGAGALAPVEKGYQGLQNRYGPRYTKVMVAAAFFALFVPIPGIAPVSVSLVVVIAEVHRALSRRGSRSWVAEKERIMSINCDVILQWGATPSQLTALGTALWRCCNRPPGGNRIYQHLDNQALADLIAGKLPGSSQTPAAERSGPHFRFRDEASLDRQATIARLRRELPAGGVEDVVVDGTSWDLTGRDQPCETREGLTTGHPSRFPANQRPRPEGPNHQRNGHDRQTSSIKTAEGYDGNYETTRATPGPGAAST